MQLRCPNCQHAVEVEGSGAFESIECPSCGSALDLLAEPTSTLATRRTIGHFELLEPIGAGSFGVVWKARDGQLDRLVAIKIPRIGLHDLDFAEQFLREARAAAQLRHPHIVAVHEVGREDGTLYIVSDFVQGMTLAERLTAGPFNPREAAQLLVHIAEALHHAHEAGVIHRDLKPQNIMLDDEGRPQLMDFGLAKRDAGEITMTVEGRMLGTPAYMSPEQARGEGHHVDRRTDVYSLGVVLFELLTGERPFRGNIQTIVNQVINEEPPSPRKLNSLISRDLETICLKCMEKVPSRRYDSTELVASELRCFLAGKPIQARPIWQVTRFWRLCQRNPITSSAIGAMVLTGLIALVVVSAALVHSNRSLRRESAALAQSEQSFQEALAAVNDLFTTVSENTLLNQPGLQPVREDLLQKALLYYQRFLKRRGSDPAVQDELAATYYRIGHITELLHSPGEALEFFETARQMQVRRLAEQPQDQASMKALGDTLVALGNVWAKQKSYAAARRAFDDAANVRNQLMTADPSNVEYQRTLANTLMNIGITEFSVASSVADRDEAKSGLRRAREKYEEAQNLRLAILEANPKNVKVRRDLAKGYFNLGNLSWTDREQKPTSAGEFYSRAVGEFQKLADESSADLGDQLSLAICCRWVGQLFLEDEKWSQARPWYQRALKQLSSLTDQNPSVVEYQRERATALLGSFQLESAVGNRSAARAALEQAREIFERLTKRFPAVPVYQRDLAVTLRKLAGEQNAAGHLKSAEIDIREAVRILTLLVEQYPENPRYRHDLEETKAAQQSKKEPELDRAELKGQVPVETGRTGSGLRHVTTVKDHGLLGAVTVVLSPDGRFAYAQGFQADAVNVFRRDEASGTLTHVQTFADPRIAGAVKLRLSRDGKLAVVACFSARSIGLFSRDAKTGELELTVTSREQTELPLQWPTDAIFSTDGRFVYTVDDKKAAVIAFQLVAERRRLDLFQSLEGESQCFDGARGIVAHPDGKTLYVTSHRAGTLTVVERQAENDRLRVRQVLRDEQGDVHGLAGVMAASVSGDGKFVYTTSGALGGDDAVSVFRVDADGTLSVVQEFINEQGGLKDYTGGNQLSLSHDETKLYASGTTSSGLACFNRDTASGRLEYLTTISNEWTGVGENRGACGIACSADGRFLYLAMQDAGAISVFEQLQVIP